MKAHILLYYTADNQCGQWLSLEFHTSHQREAVLQMPCLGLQSRGTALLRRSEEKLLMKGCLKDLYSHSGSLDQWFLTFLESCFSLRMW